MKVKSFKLINASEFSELHNQLTPAIQKWTKRWLNMDNFNLTIKNACSSDIIDELLLNSHHENGVLISIKNSFDKYCGLVFGIKELSIPFESSEVRRVIIKSFKELILSISNSINIERFDNVDVHETSRVGSGFIAAILTVNNVDIYIVCKPVFSNKGHSNELENIRFSSLTSLIQSEVISFEVYFESAELSVADLGQLQIGDVLQFKHQIQDPLKLLTIDKTLMGIGNIGKINECYAVNMLNNNLKR